jgi:hypothetical protein
LVFGVFLCRKHRRFEAAIDRGVTTAVRLLLSGVLRPERRSSDSFTAAIAHEEGGNQVILDAVYERRAPFDPIAPTCAGSACASL